MNVMLIVVSHNTCLILSAKVTISLKLHSSLKLTFCPFEMDKGVHTDNLKNEGDGSA